MVFHVNWAAAAQSPALQNVCMNNDEEAEAEAAAAISFCRSGRALS